MGLRPLVHLDAGRLRGRLVSSLCPRCPCVRCPCASGWHISVAALRRWSASANACCCEACPAPTLDWSATSSHLRDVGPGPEGWTESAREFCWLSPSTRWTWTTRPSILCEYSWLSTALSMLLVGLVDWATFAIWLRRISLSSLSSWSSPSSLSLLPLSPLSSLCPLLSSLCLLVLLVLFVSSLSLCSLFRLWEPSRWIDRKRRSVCMCA